MGNTKDIDNSFVKSGSSYSGKLTEEEQSSILENFAVKIISGQKSLDPKYQRLASENFWDLV